MSDPKLIRIIVVATSIGAVFLSSEAYAEERELTAAEQKLIEIFGEDTPRPILLWPDKPPRAIDNPPAEIVTPEGRLRSISTPTISVYLPPKEKRTGMAILMFPGGGYCGNDWRTHVVASAECLVPDGITVIGLKYRTCNPYPVSKDIQQIALLDAQRAVRLVRSRADEWGLDSDRIGVAGYSAGANLAMVLAGHFDEGDPQATDPIDRESCRPSFIVGCSTWHWREKASPFTFRRDTPPTLLVHATNDGLVNEKGRIAGAPIELPKAIDRQLSELGVPVKLSIFDRGAHGVGNLIPTRYQRGFPGAQWPKILVRWLDETNGRQ